MYYNVKVCSLWGLTLLKIRVTLKKASNKSCSDLNFVQQNPERICLSPLQVEQGDSKDQYV